MTLTFHSSRTLLSRIQWGREKTLFQMFQDT